MNKAESKLLTEAFLVGRVKLATRERDRLRKRLSRERNEDQRCVLKARLSRVETDLELAELAVREEALRKQLDAVIEPQYALGVKLRKSHSASGKARSAKYKERIPEANQKVTAYLKRNPGQLTRARQSVAEKMKLSLRWMVTHKIGK